MPTSPRLEGLGEGEAGGLGLISALALAMFCVALTADRAVPETYKGTRVSCICSMRGNPFTL